MTAISVLMRALTMIDAMIHLGVNYLSSIEIRLGMGTIFRIPFVTSDCCAHARCEDAGVGGMASGMLSA